MVSAEDAGKLVILVAEAKVSGLAAKTIYEEMARTGRSCPEAIMRERGLEQVSDVGALESAVKKVLDENPNELERYRQGETKLLGFFVGQVMKASSGKADPKKVGEIVSNRLKQ